VALFKKVEQYVKRLVSQMQFRPLTANTALHGVNLNVINTINLFARPAHRSFIARAGKMPEKFQFSFITSAAVFEIDRGARCLGTTGQVMVPRALRKIKMAHKVTVKITRVRQRVIQTYEIAQRHHCQTCQREVVMLTSVEASRVLEIDHQMLAGLIGEGRIHAIESASGKLWVCKESLFLK
jgi:hypothetical protein